MFSRYRSEIVESNIHTKLSELEGYNNCIKEIIDANDCFDSSTTSYLNAIKDFPHQTVEVNEADPYYKLTKNILGMLFVSVHIGTTKYKFLFDTGAQLSCINSKLLRTNLGVHDSSKYIPVGDASGNFEDILLVKVDHVSVLNIGVYNMPMLAISEDKLSLKILGKTLADIDGVLGWDMISKIDFELDYTNLKINVIPSQPNNIYRNFIKASFPTVLVEDPYNNIKIFGFDSGARRSWINEHLIRDLNLIVSKEKTTRMRGAHGPRVEKVKRVKSCQIQLREHKIILHNVLSGYTKFLNNLEYHGIFGIDIAKNHILVFNNSREQISIKKLQ